MSPETVQALLDQYVDTIYTQVSTYLLYYIGGLALFWVAFLYLRPGRGKQVSRRSAFVPNTVVGPRDAALGIAPVHIPAAPRPVDNSYFQTVLEFAQTKITQGKPLFPLERLVLGELTFLHHVLVSDGLAYLDSFSDGLPHKSHELRQALQEIGAYDLIDPVERAVALYLHRRQRVMDLAALGVSRADALLHQDLPSYDALSAELEHAGAAAYFLQKANMSLADGYPWASVA